MMVIKYQKEKDRFITGSNSNDVSIVSYTKQSFIELTRDNLPSKIINDDDNNQLKLVLYISFMIMLMN